MKNWNMARDNENKVEHDVLWPCIAWLWLEIDGIVSRYAPGRYLNVSELPQPWNEQDEQK